MTFIENADIDLQTLNIGESAASELRGKFAAFEDWSDPEMDVYNDYDNARAMEWFSILSLALGTPRRWASYSIHASMTGTSIFLINSDTFKIEAKTKTGAGTISRLKMNNPKQVRARTNWVWLKKN